MLLGGGLLSLSAFLVFVVFFVLSATPQTGGNDQGV